MLRERKVQGLRESLGPEQIRKGDEYVFFCPRCKHRKPKLSVNVETDAFHCWVDNFKGLNLAPLLKGEIKAEYVTELKGTGADRRPPEKKYDEVRLPTEFRTLTKEWRGPYYQAAVNYLSSRGVGPKEILRWKLGYCEDGEYRYRIIVPSFDEYGHLNFFVGRYFYDNTDVVKYKSGNFCKDIVWNDYQVDWDRPVTLVEGPFDAMKVADNVVALQGTILHDKLLTRIVASGVPVTVALDSDARDKQYQIIHELLSYGVDCNYTMLYGRKDLGEMTTDEAQRCIRNATPVPDLLCLLKYKVMA